MKDSAQAAHICFHSYAHAVTCCAAPCCAGSRSCHPTRTATHTHTRARALTPVLRRESELPHKQRGGKGGAAAEEEQAGASTAVFNYTYFDSARRDTYSSAAAQKKPKLTAGGWVGVGWLWVGYMAWLQCGGQECGGWSWVGGAGWVGGLGEGGCLCVFWPGMVTRANQSAQCDTQRAGLV